MYPQEFLVRKAFPNEYGKHYNPDQYNEVRGADPSKGDVVRGGGMSDTLVGTDRADFIWGGGGPDTLTGGAGADIFYFSADPSERQSNSVVDVITDFEQGIDRINVPNWKPDVLVWASGGTTTLQDPDGLHIVLKGEFHLTSADFHEYFVPEYLSLPVVVQGEPTPGKKGHILLRPKAAEPQPEPEPVPEPVHETPITRPAPLDVFRFYNHDTGTHFFTASQLERDIVRNTLRQYEYEGVGFKAVPDQPGADPIFRFFNTQTNAHFFTPSEAERDAVIARLPQYSYEGVGFHASNRDAAGLTEVYRFYNTQTGVHFYTPSVLEKNIVQSTLPTYQFEGVGFYVPDRADYVL